MTLAGVTRVLAGRDLMQGKSLPAHRDGQNHQQKNSVSFALHEVGLKSLTANAGGYSKSPHAKPAMGCEVTKEYRDQITVRYSNSRRWPAMHLPLAAKMPFASTGLPMPMCLRKRLLPFRGATVKWALYHSSVVLVPENVM